MDTLYNTALRYMEQTLGVFESRVRVPQRKSMGDSIVFRYIEQSIHQAIVQKLARLVSGLHAARILLEHGFTQEQGALHRMLDEFEQDVTFLSFAAIFNDVTPLHQQFLSAFMKRSLINPIVHSARLKNAQWYLGKRFELI